MQIKVVHVKVGSPAVVATIDRGLDAFQAAVGGGYVECVSHIGVPNVSLWCDEEGRLKRLPRNRYVPVLGQWIHGNFFLTGGADSEGETLPVPEEQVAFLLAVFNEGMTL